MTVRERLTDRAVLLVISGGLILILLAIIVGLFVTPRSLPNWAENVLVSIATASALKLGDCLATLVALSHGRQTERLGTQLAEALPATSSLPVPRDAAEGAQQAAGAAEQVADRLATGAPP